MSATRRYVKSGQGNEVKPDYAAFAIYLPYPNAPTFERGAELGLYTADCWDKLMRDPLCGEKVPVCWEEHLSKDELLDLLKICHRRFYFEPNLLLILFKIKKLAAELKRLSSSALSLLRMELLSTTVTKPV